jgi:hypothetical protein
MLFLSSTYLYWKIAIITPDTASSIVRLDDQGKTYEALKAIRILYSWISSRVTITSLERDLFSSYVSARYGASFMWVGQSTRVVSMNFTFHCQ